LSEHWYFGSQSGVPLRLPTETALGAIMPLKRNYFLVPVFGAILAAAGLVHSANAIDLFGGLFQAPTACASAKDCVVAGAEIDDEGTAKARAKSGSGPATGFASDRRIKSDVTQIGQLENGIKIYSFKFIWEDKTRVGVIAQDLLEREDTKAAVLQLSNGLLGVDYTALGLRVATLEQWREAGISAVKADYKPQSKRTAKLDDAVRLFNRAPGY
jgi:hypothetical protein